MQPLSKHWRLIDYIFVKQEERSEVRITKDQDADIQTRLHTKNQLFRSHLNNPNPVVKRDAYLKDKRNKHNAELQRTNPGTKVTGKFSTKGRIFRSNAQNGLLSGRSLMIG